MESLLDKSIYYTTDEVRFLTSMEVPNQLYIKDKSTWEKYSNIAFDRITIRSNDDNNKIISCSKYLLRNMLKETALINYLLNHDEISISYVDDKGNISLPLKYSKKEIIDLLNEVISKYPNEFSKQDIFHFNMLKINKSNEELKNDLLDEVNKYIDSTYNELEKVVHFYNRLIDMNLVFNFKDILDLLKIKYEIKNGFFNYKYGEYDVVFDIYNKSIECINTNKVTRDKFDELNKRVKNNITFNKKKEIEFNNSLELYRNYFLKDNVLSDEELYRLFFSCIKKSDLIGFDSINYIKDLFNKIIGRFDNVKLEFLTKRICDDYSFNVVALISNEAEEKYVLMDYHDDELFKIITKEELNKMLSTKEYIKVFNENDLSSYGLNVKGGIPYNVRKIKSNM